MFKVYWTEQFPIEQLAEYNYGVDNLGEEPFKGTLVPVEQGQTFLQTQLTEATQFCEALRKRRREGALVSFICMQGENPDCVGEQGVSDKLPEGYDWTKQDRAGRPRRR